MGRNIGALQNDHDTAVSLIPAILNIFALWNLTDEQQRILLGLSEGRELELLRARSALARLNRDFLERTSYLLGIYRALQVLLPETEMADAWLNKPNENPLFHGSTPMQRMLAGLVVDLAVVRDHLVSQLSA